MESEPQCVNESMTNSNCTETVSFECRGRSKLFHIVMPPSACSLAALVVALAWTLIMAFDLLIFVFTLVYRIRTYVKFNNSPGSRSLLSLMLRDGALNISALSLHSLLTALDRDCILRVGAIRDASIVI